MWLWIQGKGFWHLDLDNSLFVNTMWNAEGGIMEFRPKLFMKL